MRYEGGTALTLRLTTTVRNAELEVYFMPLYTYCILNTVWVVTGTVAGAEQVCGNVLQAGRPQKKCSVDSSRGVRASLCCGMQLEASRAGNTPKCSPLCMEPVHLPVRLK